MSTLPKARPEPRVLRVTFAKHSFTVHLNDGRALSVPYAYSARLAEATAKQRAEYEMIGRGIGIQ